MQAQTNIVGAQAITHSQSLAAVQTLLRAGLSCITFLRNLLPDENFTESHLTTADNSIPLSSSETDSPQHEGNKKTRVNGFKIMTMTKGYTDEADRILNYLENGIFDALQKQYLRSFIFAIYLDSKDPNNIVEAYTFNFKYHTLPGTNTVLPVMTLGEDLQNMSLNNSYGRMNDPVAEAARMGKIPTLRDVKRSVKAMTKMLIQAITHMDELPRRRFATFKVFYTDETPADYEPPHFQTGDDEKDKWYFMTHNLDEVPDRFSIGRVNCGHHSVNLKVTSIATYLPSSTDHDNAPFAGTVAKGMLPPRLSPNEEALACFKQAEKQQEDAMDRNLVWSAEADLELGGDEDAEGEDDPDYVRRPDGVYERIGELRPLNEPYFPIGLRNEDGEIEKLQVRTNLNPVAHFGGIQDSIPTRLKEINAKETPEIGAFEETQALVETQTYEIQSRRRSPSLRQEPLSDSTGHRNTTSPLSLPSSSLARDLGSPITSVLDNSISNSGDEEKGKHIVCESIVAEDSEMLDLETQISPNFEAEIVESIQSFTLDEPTEARAMTLNAAEDEDESEATPGRCKAIDVGLDCDCGITIEDEQCFCEGKCGRWYHVWCMGFHSTEDSRLPQKFVCFDCRFKADRSWELLKDDIYPNILAKYKEFVTFRRAIKVFEESKTLTPLDFAKAFDGNNSLARQLIKQLEAEGFVQEVTTTLDDFGLTIESRNAKNRKAKDRKARPRKNFQKIRYAFNRQVKFEQKYKDYFTPEQDVESRMLGLNDLRNFRTETIAAKSAAASRPLADQIIETAETYARDADSQTQDATQPFIRKDSQKRGSDAAPDPEAVDRPMKRLKVSVTAGIDLAE